MAQIETQPRSVVQLCELRNRLHGRGYEAGIADGALTVYGAQADDGPRPTMTITCEPRVIDRDRLWFWDGHEALEEASHVVDAAIWVAQRIGPTS